MGTVPMAASQQVTEFVSKRARHARGQAADPCDTNIAVIGFAKIVYRLGFEVGAKKWKRACTSPRALRSFTARVGDGRRYAQDDVRVVELPQRLDVWYLRDFNIVAKFTELAVCVAGKNRCSNEDWSAASK